MPKKKHRTEEEFAEEYKTFLEKLYERSRIYRNLVFMSRIARMIFYLIFGVSIIFVVLSGKPIVTIERIIYWLSGNTIGKILAVVFGFLLIIYGIEKPRG